MLVVRCESEEYGGVTGEVEFTLTIYACGHLHIV